MSKEWGVGSRESGTGDDMDNPGGVSRSQGLELDTKPPLRPLQTAPRPLTS